MALHSNQEIHKLSLLPAGMVCQFLKIKNLSVIKSVFSQEELSYLTSLTGLPSNIPWQMELRAEILHMQHSACGEKASFSWKCGQKGSLPYILQ